MRGALLIAAGAGACAGPGGDTSLGVSRSLEARLSALQAGDLELPGADSAIVRLMPPLSYDVHARPLLNGLPAHLRAVVGDISLLVIPVEDYRLHFIGGPRAGFERRFGALRDIIAAGNHAVEGEIPVFPPPRAAQRFRARREWIPFGGGRGVAFVTQFSDDASPPRATDFRWVFLGLTDDGAWLVSVIHPLRIYGTPASENPRAVAAAIDTLAAESFDPDPAALVRRVRELRIAGVASSLQAREP